MRRLRPCAVELVGETVDRLDNLLEDLGEQPNWPLASSGLNRKRIYTSGDYRHTPIKYYDATRPAAALEGTSQANADQSTRQWVAPMLRRMIQFDCTNKYSTLSVSQQERVRGIGSGSLENNVRFQRQAKLESYKGVGFVRPSHFYTTSQACKHRLHSEEL